MSDLIYRQAAIEALADYIHNVDKVYSTGHLSMEDCDDAARSVIEELPSAEPESKKGKWIDYTEDGYVECPFCHSATNCDGNKDELHFCFSCGADMRGGDAE